MNNATRQDIRHAVEAAMEYWPNAHLGDISRREDMRSAFQMIRNNINRGESTQAATGILMTSAYRHVDM